MIVAGAEKRIVLHGTEKREKRDFRKPLGRRARPCQQKIRLDHRSKKDVQAAGSI